MKTSKYYNDCIKQGIIPSMVLGNVIFSYNKRAKNMRDKEREWRHTFKYCKYDYAGKYQEKKEQYYDKKDKLLQLVKPCKIHKVNRIKYVKTFDWQEDFDGWKDVYSFFDRKGHYHEYNVEGQVRTEYYLFYSVGEHTFHHPIDEKEIELYKNLPVQELEELETNGEATENLLSVQFCDKVLNGLTSGALKIA